PSRADGAPAPHSPPSNVGNAVDSAVDNTVSSAAPPASAATVRKLRARDDFDRNVWCVMGAPLDVADVPEALSILEGAVRDGERLSFVTPNVNWLVRALSDTEARRQIIDADLSLADGAPLVAIARALGAPITSRTAGSDLFEALRQRSAFDRPLKVYFFGGRDGSAEAAHAAVNADRGGLASVGWQNPGFGSVEDMSAPHIIDAINAAAPDFIVVALGAAKGQAWIDRNQAQLDAAAMAHLGAVVDFTAGAIERAPSWMARSGLEWAWRIKAEPSLWKRYAEDAGALAALSFKKLLPQLMRRKRARTGDMAQAACARAGEKTRITLSGALVGAQLGAVRDAFREAARAGRPVVLDFAASTTIDHAFLGLVLMLEKHMARAGGHIELANVSDETISLFRGNAMDYPIVQYSDAAPAGAATDAAVA
ncbi:MAG: WecB/TagA/CpsF family glycosyltransferase, partial [Pseudomonadota bacterium]